MKTEYMSVKKTDQLAINTIRSLAMFNAAAAAASALGAIAGGAVADRFGYESVNVFAAAGALLSLLCVWPLRNARQQVRTLNHVLNSFHFPRGRISISCEDICEVLTRSVVLESNKCLAIKQEYHRF